jgi:hypothetical protein
VANRYYQADVTYWVDPRTGVLIDQQEKGVSYLHGPTGQGYLTVADFNLRMTDASSRALAAGANKNAAQMTLIRLTAPVGGVVLGLILILLAAIPAGRYRTQPGRHLIRPARRSPHPPAAPGET